MYGAISNMASFFLDDPIVLNAEDSDYVLNTEPEVVAVDESTESEAEYQGKGNWLLTTSRNSLTANPLADPAASVSFILELTPPHSSKRIIPADYVFDLSKE
jgi:hypothetical protein